MTDGHPPGSQHSSPGIVRSRDGGIASPRICADGLPPPPSVCGTTAQPRPRSAGIRYGVSATTTCPRSTSAPTGAAVFPPLRLHADPPPGCLALQAARGCAHAGSVARGSRTLRTFPRRSLGCRSAHRERRSFDWKGHALARCRCEGRVRPTLKKSSRSPPGTRAVTGKTARVGAQTFRCALSGLRSVGRGPGR